MWTVHALPSPAVDIALWRVDIDPHTNWHASLVTGLPLAEEAKALRFVQIPDRLRYIATRKALRQVLTARDGLNAADLVFQPGRYGKPWLASGRHFNVSHAGAHALIAISERGPVGIDIEQVRPIDHLAQLTAEVCAAAERVWLDKSDDTTRFHALWSAKEAVLKSWGCGIAGNLQRLAVVPDAAVPIHFDGIPLTHTRVWLLPGPFGYVAALAAGPEHNPFDGGKAGQTVPTPDRVRRPV
ncbi:4'-phosphopantetheinyl transferase family protein [Chitinolyticbacter albus]|uniref:4'-phosphopantetheinyl transferase family protein n=1 Tax=Chitinolyticbacter albus TaxID=2961951 RepID=UPI00210CA893|nr:4'-phosphopantetheinyl transferase superfamily protein [Chitinolyticbacter albus]